MAETTAALSGVVVRYPGRPPLGPIDLSIRAGEIIAIVGAVVTEFVSGSGATQGLAWRLLEAGASWA